MKARSIRSNRCGAARLVSSDWPDNGRSNAVLIYVTAVQTRRCRHAESKSVIGFAWVFLNSERGLNGVRATAEPVRSFQARFIR